MFPIHYSNKKLIVRLVLALAIFAMGAGGCNSAEPATPTPNMDLPTPTDTPFTPSPTPEPLAAVVNGEGLLLADYEAEVERYLLAMGEESSQSLAETQRLAILDQMIDETLLIQAAVEAGYELTDEEFEQRLRSLEEAAGGADALKEWMDSNGYTAETFAASLRRSIKAAWQRDQIISQVPETSEQVHARQILVRDEELAGDILGNLRSGADFATLAFRYDPLTGGDLGWFPRGFLLVPEIEEAAFALQPGETSEIISTTYGYHILEVIERDEQRPLEPDALKTLQRQEIENWLKERREQGQIEIELP